MLATLIVYCSIFWPPVPRTWVQGAIGKRDLRRHVQMSDKDLGVAGQARVTQDDLRKFLQSSEFLALANNEKFQQAIASGALGKQWQSGQLQQGLTSGTLQQQFGVSISAENLPILGMMAASSQVKDLASHGQLASAVGSTELAGFITAGPRNK